MRVTTNLIYDKNLRAINQSQGDLSDIQTQLATGKKLLRPSDDPVGASQVIRLTEEIDKIEQYKRNGDLVTNALELQGTVLGSINDVVDRARELTVQAGNGILSAPDKEALGCVHFAFFRALVAVAALGYNQSAASHPALKGKSYQTGAAYREQ